MLKKILVVVSVVLIFIFLLFCCLDNKKSNNVISDDLISYDVVKEDVKDSTEKYYVEIKGAVINPGVYQVDSSSRIIDVVDMAGGLREDADTRYINLSKKVKDEMDIIIYTHDEVNSRKESNVVVVEQECVCPSIVNDACLKEVTDNNLISINSASLDELTKIPGIGESKAKAIIEYRNSNKFSDIKDIMNIKGIGQSLFDTIKEYITV